MAARKRKARRKQLAPVRIAVVNNAEKKPIARERLAKVLAALETQLERDFAPVWGVSAELSLVPEGELPPEDAWWLTLHDDSDRAGDLGYHDLTSAGLPLGKAFVATAEENGMPWSVVLSHELLEMLIDPYINLAAVIRQGGVPNGMLYGYEVCDPVRSDTYRIDSVAVSNFVYPAWFEADRPRRGTRFDHLERVAAPLRLRPGGYAITSDIKRKGGWKTTAAGARKRRRPRRGSRLHRRTAAAETPMRSKPKRPAPKRRAR
jgi:hypothetical protein